MATTFMDLTTSWQQISATATVVQVSSGTVMMQSQPTIPADTDTRGHIMFGDKNLAGLGWINSIAGEKLYARALQGKASIVLSPDIG